MSVQITERDFPEDFTLENGDYRNQCTACSAEFTGYKQRVICKVCQLEQDKTQSAARLKTEIEAAEKLQSALQTLLGRVETDLYRLKEQSIPFLAEKVLAAWNRQEGVSELKIGAIYDRKSMDFGVSNLRYANFPFVAVSEIGIRFLGEPSLVVNFANENPKDPNDPYWVSHVLVSVPLDSFMTTAEIQCLPVSTSKQYLTF